MRDGLLCVHVEAFGHGPNAQAEECFDIPNDKC